MCTGTRGVLYRRSTLCTFAGRRERWFVRRALLAVLIELTPIPYIAAAAARGARYRYGDPMSFLASLGMTKGRVEPRVTGDYHQCTRQPMHERDSTREPVLPVSLRVMRIRNAVAASVAIAFPIGGVVSAQSVAPPTAGASRLTVERIFGSGEFAARGAGQLRWLDDSTYVALQANPQQAGTAELARFNARTGARDVLVPSAWLTPNGATGPLQVENYIWSPDKKRLLVFTASEKVWRENTRGDYWVLDLATHDLRKLGGDAPASTLMFAKFSPDGRRVGYVRQNDLYVEDAANGAITRLTNDGSRTIINGTFDWVYEEELALRDGFRWSPDGSTIAFWQLDASGVKDFSLINNTDSLYSFAVPVQYPKAGGMNSAGRIGVVSAAGGQIRWLTID